MGDRIPERLPFENETPSPQRRVDCSQSRFSGAGQGPGNEDQKIAGMGNPNGSNYEN